MTASRLPPPLPPRSQPPQSATTPSTLPPQQDNDYLTPSAIGIGYSSKLHAADPRTSSSQSLLAPATESDTRRSLLIIYIHGFYGTAQSFKSFPAHLHTFLTELLSETHIVHSKIYPRYKTYKAIQVARDNFSAWLEPHESPSTDVILVGHSMGGLLAAEVVLMPNHDPHLHQAFKHRILGTISLDSPFLGLHPGIVVSGLSSLFQPASKSDKDSVGSASQSSLGADPSESSDLQYPLSATPSSSSVASSAQLPRRRTDPLYDEPFFNDAPFREKPFITRLWNFASKHKTEGIFNAIGNHIFSHLEFGGCMADYPELSSRYKRIRALEDVNEIKAVLDGHPPEAHRRVRFVNYYTLSPGRPKPPPPPPAPELAAADSSLSALSLDEVNKGDEILGVTEAGQLPKADILSAADDSEKPKQKTSSLDDADAASEYDTAGEEPPNHDELEDDDRSSQDLSHISMQNLDPEPMMEDAEEATTATITATAAPDDATTIHSAQGTLAERIPSELDLVPIPPEPEAPPDTPDFSQYTDKDARKQAEKESKRRQKAYQQAVKDRSKAIREREKLLEKRRKKADKEAQRLEKETLKEMQALQRERDKAIEEATKAAAAEAAAEAQVVKGEGEEGEEATSSGTPQQAPKKKLKKFCSLPGKVDGVVDPTWIDVYMEDVDEVGAHCGLFEPGAHYDKLIGDMGSRVMAWVHEDMSTRAALAM